MTTAMIAATICDNMTATNACNLGERAVEIDRGVVEKSSRGNTADCANSLLVDADDSFLSFPMQDFEDDGDCFIDELYCEEPALSSDLEVSTPAADNIEADASEMSLGTSLEGMPAATATPLVDNLYIVASRDFAELVCEETLLFRCDLLDHHVVEEAPRPDPIVNDQETRENGPLAPYIDLTSESAREEESAVVTDDEDTVAASETDDGTSSDNYPRICWDLDVQRLTETYQNGQLADHDIILLHCAQMYEKQRQADAKRAARNLRRRQRRQERRRAEARAVSRGYTIHGLEIIDECSEEGEGVDEVITIGPVLESNPEPSSDGTEGFLSVELPRFAVQQEEATLDTLSPLLDADSLVDEFLADILDEGNRFLSVSTAIGVC